MTTEKQKKGVSEKSSFYHRKVGMERVFKEFFNITEEDLK